MSTISVAQYYPWSRVKVIEQAVHYNNGNAIGAQVRLQPDRRFRPQCHDCCSSAQAIHSTHHRFVRDLPLADQKVYLLFEYRKIWCPRCNAVRVEHLEFADAGQHVTHRLANYAVQLCTLGLSVKQVAEHLDLDRKTVKALEKEALQTQFGKTNYAGLRQLAIDEIAIRKGHNYMTVVLDYQSGRVVWMGEGRKAENVDAFFRQMPPTVRKNIEAVSMDMWEAYIKVVQKWCPNAAIVFDLFHVVKAFNKVIDEIRLHEYQKATDQGRSVLQGSKYLLLKNWDNLKRKQKATLLQILKVNERLNVVYYLKELLKYVWTYRYRASAKKALAEWCRLAREDGHSALTRFARKLEFFAYGILNHCDYPINNGQLEGVNNKIKVIKRIAYGFHDQGYFALKVKQAFPGQISTN